MLASDVEQAKRQWDQLAQLGVTTATATTAADDNRDDHTVLVANVREATAELGLALNAMDRVVRHLGELGAFSKDSSTVDAADEVSAQLSTVDAANAVLAQLLRRKPCALRRVARWRSISPATSPRCTRNCGAGQAVHALALSLPKQGQIRQMSRRRRYYSSDLRSTTTAVQSACWN